jgi:XTP/dITP diphosphohydrolase
VSAAGRRRARGGAASRRRAKSPELIVATSNPGKLREIRALLAELAVELCGLERVPGLVLPEEGDDYAANAAAKALAVARASGRPALADDSGLEVAGLGGAPGPGSARYGGPDLDDAGRLRALLAALAGARGEARAARFVCVAALATPQGRVVARRGECRGRILEAPRGADGFGYDPVFAPEGSERSFAELPAAEKNRRSHRAVALRKLAPAIRRELEVEPE